MSHLRTFQPETNLVIWGVPPNANTTEIILPEDTVRVRVRFRNNGFAKIWVKTSCGIRQFYLAYEGPKFKCVFEQGANYRK